MQAGAPIPVPVASVPSAVATSNYTEARLQFRLPAGMPLTHTFNAQDTLQAVYDYVQANAGLAGFKIFSSFPRKLLDDKQKTLKELGLVPSSALIVQQ
jgi:hypothetical protein